MSAFDLAPEPLLWLDCPLVERPPCAPYRRRPDAVRSNTPLLGWYPGAAGEPGGYGIVFHDGEDWVDAEGAKVGGPARVAELAREDGCAPGCYFNDTFWEEPPVHAAHCPLAKKEGSR